MQITGYYLTSRAPKTFENAMYTPEARSLSVQAGSRVRQKAQYLPSGQYFLLVNMAILSRNNL